MTYLSETLTNFISHYNITMVVIVDYLFLHILMCMLLPIVYNVLGFILLEYKGRFILHDYANTGSFFGLGILFRRLFCVYMDYAVSLFSFFLILLIPQQHYERYVKTIFSNSKLKMAQRHLVKLSKDRS